MCYDTYHGCQNVNCAIPAETSINVYCFKKNYAKVIIFNITKNVQPVTLHWHGY